jgi:hypothetical protein
LCPPSSHAVASPSACHAAWLAWHAISTMHMLSLLACHAMASPSVCFYTSAMPSQHHHAMASQPEHAMASQPTMPWQASLPCHGKPACHAGHAISSPTTHYAAMIS